MKTITLKADDTFFDKLSALAKELHLSKSELIRRSVSEFEKINKVRQMKAQMKMASMKVREKSLEINKGFDDSLEDGLKDV